MRPASAGDTSPTPSTRRLRLDDLCSNLCWLFMCSCISFPVPVTRNRLAVPLWVFCFGILWRPLLRVSASLGSVQPPTAPAVSVVRWNRSGAGRLLLSRRVLLRLRRTAGGVGCCLVPVLGDHHDHVAAVLL